MLIDLSRVLTHEGKKLNIEVEPVGENYVCEMGSFAYAEKSPVSLAIAHTENQVLRMEGNGHVAVWILSLIHI